MRILCLPGSAPGDHLSGTLNENIILSFLRQTDIWGRLRVECYKAEVDELCGPESAHAEAGLLMNTLARGAAQG